MSKSRKLPVQSLITAAIVLSVTFYFIHICWQGINQGFVEEGWIAVEATVLDPDLTLDTKKDRDRVQQGIEQTLNYEYQVDDQVYRTNSVSREIFVDLNEYPQGRTFTAYYNPANASEAIIVRTPVQAHYLYGFIVFCLIVVGVVVLSLIRDFKNS